MTALLATPRTDGGVLLSVTGAPAGALILSRTDANGFARVRQPATLAVTGTRWMVDYEAAMTGPLRYLVVDAAGEATYATATWAGVTGLGPQLRRVYKPDVAVALEAVVDVAASRALRYSQHQVLGRPDDVFTTYRQGLRQGTLTLQATTLPAADAIARLYADGQVARLRTPDHRGLDMAHLGLAVSPAAQDYLPDGRLVWSVSVTYAEVVPDDATTLAGWTCQDVLDTYASAAEMSLAYTTWADVLADTVGVPA